MRHAAGSDRRNDLAPRPAVSLRDDLDEWHRWLCQGNTVTDGYPPESSTESLAIPFKRSPTTEEQQEEFMATRSADERIGERLDSWVRSLKEPFRAAIQVQFHKMRDDDKRVHTFKVQPLIWQRMRASKCQEMWNQRSELRHTMDVDRYEAALSLAMDLLQDIEKRRAGGV